MTVYVRFERPVDAGRMSKQLGPFDYVQVTYNELRASPDGEVLLAEMGPDGRWETQDGLEWSDFVVTSRPEE